MSWPSLAWLPVHTQPAVISLDHLRFKIRRAGFYVHALPRRSPNAHQTLWRIAGQVDAENDLVGGTGGYAGERLGCQSQRGFI